MVMATENPVHANPSVVVGPPPRTRDQLFCLELAGQAADVYFDRTWEQIEPILEGTWDNGAHEMSWCEARWFVKCAWTDCLNRGAAGQGEIQGTTATPV